MRKSAFGVKGLYLSSSNEHYVDQPKKEKPRYLDSYRFKYPDILPVIHPYKKNALPLEFRTTPESLLNLTLRVVDKFPLSDVYDWDIEKVCRWLRNYGYPQYQNIFRGNLINGRNLLLLDASALPAMNIKDFDHIRHITYGIRCLFQFEITKYARSISLPKENFRELYKLLRVKNGRIYEHSKPSELFRRMQLIRPVSEYKDHWDLMESCLNSENGETVRIGASRRFILCPTKIPEPKQEKVVEVPCICMPPCECNWTKRHVKPQSKLRCISPGSQEPVDVIKVLSVLPSRFHEHKRDSSSQRNLRSSVFTWNSTKSFTLLQ